MTQGLWQKLFVVAGVMLVAAIILGGSLWQQLNATETRLNDIEAQLSAVKPGIDSLKAEQEQMLSEYASLRRQIELRLGIGQDAQHFITPDDPEISAEVQEITGGYSTDAKELWKDYASLLQWVVRNVKYSADSPLPLFPESTDGALEWRKDFWRLPVETMRDKAGDCEDMATLLASMLLSYTQQSHVFWVVGARTFDSIPKGHVAVAIPSENNNLTIFDPAGRYWTPFPTVGGYGSQEVSLAIKDWLAHLEEMPDAEIYVVFSEKVYQEFSTTQEFIEWAYGF
jgi:dihydrofolate reductase